MVAAGRSDRSADRAGSCSANEWNVASPYLTDPLCFLVDQSEFYTLAYFETDTPGTYCIGQALLVAPGVAKMDFQFQASTANCTEVEI